MPARRCSPLTCPSRSALAAGMAGMTPAAMSGGLGQMAAMGGMGLPAGGSTQRTAVLCAALH